VKYNVPLILRIASRTANLPSAIYRKTEEGKRTEGEPMGGTSRKRERLGTRGM